MNSESIQVLQDWPEIASVPEPRIQATDNSLVLRYITSDERVAIIEFPLVSFFTFGSPNDEALNGHPLYSKGLEFYSVHKVDNSSLIQQLEQRNSVHPSHNKSRFLAGMVHYIFTFQDSTLECISNEMFDRNPKIRLFDNGSEADQVWQSISNA